MKSSTNIFSRFSHRVPVVTILKGGTCWQVSYHRCGANERTDAEGRYSLAQSSRDEITGMTEQSHSSEWKRARELPICFSRIINLSFSERAKERVKTQVAVFPNIISHKRTSTSGEKIRKENEASSRVYGTYTPNQKFDFIRISLLQM